MKRSNPPTEKKDIQIPDIINRSAFRNFTQIPNELLRDPKLSAKAKGILCLLLSNQDGWHSYMTTIDRMMKDGETAIRTGLKELEKHGYLHRIRYRDKVKKQIQGSFWIYGDRPHVFYNLKEIDDLLDNKGMVADWPEKLNLENLDEGFLDEENGSLIIPINKKTNNKKTNSGEDGDKIKVSQFDEFWEMYPRKHSKGKAKTKWKTICHKKDRSEVPDWEEVKQALQEQKESEQWQDPDFIPHPTTWLNQSRWLDDPDNLRSYSKKKSKPSAGYKSPGYKYREVDETV